MAGLEPEAYGGCKDVSAAWAVGVLAAIEIPEELWEIWEERASIMVYDGHVPRAAAERLAWAGLPPEGEAP